MDNNQVDNTEIKPAVSEAESTSEFTFNEKTIMASLSYLGILVLIPLFLKKEDPFVAFHVKQGLVLLVPSVLIYVLGHTMHLSLFYVLFSVINVAVICLSILGIINALRQKQADLPFVGQFTKYIKI